VDRGEDGAHHRACDGHLGQLEGDGAGVTHDTRPDLDQLELEAGQRPVGHGLGQFDAAQEGGQVVGQRMKPKADLVLRLALSGQPRPVDCVLAFLDMLLCCAALIVEADDPVRLHRQVGDDEADFGEQLARMPFDLRYDTAGLVPGRRLILEVLVKAFDRGQRRPPCRSRQSMRDLLLEHCIGGQPR